MHEVKIAGKSITLVADRTEALKFVYDYAADHSFSVIRMPEFDDWDRTLFILSDADFTEYHGEIVHISGKEYFD